MNHILFSVSAMCLIILLLIFLLKKLNQPYMIAYILAGILIGPFAGKLFVDPKEVAALGEIGILLLMFFLGMEIDIPDNKSQLLKPVIAQGIKMLLAILFAFVLGRLFLWPIQNILLLAILFIFNSTAVVSEYLVKNGDLQTMSGKTILNVLLLQDILLAPVLTIFQLMGHKEISLMRLGFAVVASIVIVILLRAARHRNKLNPAILKQLEHDHELQVFLGALLCVGVGLIAEMAGLSTAIGGFLAGILIGRTSAFHWLEHALKPFRVFFVSFFFMSIGLSVELDFVIDHLDLILLGTLFMLLSNSLISAFVFRLLRYSWKNSLYGGALLSQTGEFGILACSLAYEMNIVDHDFFKSGVAITAMSLVFSTTWITILGKLILKRSSF